MPLIIIIIIIIIITWFDWIGLLRLCSEHYTIKHLTALCPGLPGSAGTRKVKPIWIFLKQETVSGSGRWQQLGHMQVYTSLQQPTTQFLQAGCPSCRPTDSVKALKDLN